MLKARTDQARHAGINYFIVESSNITNKRE